MIAPVSSPVTAPAVAAGVSDAAQKTLGSNFDTFLTLLTTQLQNQDPLSPMDSSQFTQQLVQFSSVEQQINANKNLETLISLTQSRSNADAVSYLGKTVTTTDGSAALQNGKADWTYALDQDAISNALMVSDANGRLVYTTAGATGSGAHDFTWNGTDLSGNPLPDGAYALTVHALLGNGNAVTNTVKSQGQVSEVDLSGTEPLLMIGAMGVPLSKASLISGM